MTFSVFSLLNIAVPMSEHELLKFCIGFLLLFQFSLLFETIHLDPQILPVLRLTNLATGCIIQVCV